MVSSSGGTPTVLTAAFDEDPNLVEWLPNGLYFAAGERTFSHLYRVDVGTKAIAKVTGAETRRESRASRSRRTAPRMRILRSDAKSMSEVYVGSWHAEAARER